MNHFRRLKTASFLIAFIFTLPILVIAGQYKVIRVVDGDTIVVDYQGKHEKVRLLCVNTPESVHPDKKQNIPMGKVASNYAKKKLSGKYVDLEFEGSRRRGNYGRLLLDGLEKKIFVAKYKVKLPSEEKIKQALKKL